jgi:hypothetical protein
MPAAAAPGARWGGRGVFANSPIETALKGTLSRPLYPLIWCSGSGPRRRQQ